MLEHEIEWSEMLLMSKSINAYPVVGQIIGNVIVDLVVFGVIALLIFYLVRAILESKRSPRAQLSGGAEEIESPVQRDDYSGLLRLLILFISVGAASGFFLPQLDFTGLLPTSYGLPQSMSIMNSIWQCIFHAPNWFFTKNSIRSECLAVGGLIVCLISSIMLVIYKDPSRLLFKVRQLSAYASLLGTVWSIWLFKSLIDSLDLFLKSVGNNYRISLLTILGAGAWVSLISLACVCVLSTLDALRVKAWDDSDFSEVRF